MKTTRITLMALILGVILSTHAFAEQVWNEQRITNTPWAEGSPKVWGDQLYYSDRMNGYGEIYAFDQAHGSRRLLGGDGIDRSVNAVYGETLVVGHYNPVNDQNDLYIYDPINGERPISTATGDKYGATIFGTTVVYVQWDFRHGVPQQVYIWDPINGNMALFPSSTWQDSPKIYGSRIVWDSQYGTYMWTPGGGAVRLGGGISPAVYEDKVVNWTLARDEWNGNGYDLIPGYLWEWTPAGGWKTLAQHTITDSLGVINTQLWGDLVVWQYGRDIPHIKAWDPVHGFSIVGQSTYGWDPTVYGDKVAWRGMGAEGRGDIYLSTMVPEPASLLALAGGVGFLLLRARRKSS